jgi:putative drug exporter of the RND superfamily
VFVQSSTRTVNDPAFRAMINDVAAAVKGNPAIKNLKSPLDPKNRDQVSKNRRTVIVTWNMKGKADVAKKKIDGVEASVAKVGDRHPGFYVGETGSVSSGKALDKMFADQLKLAGERSIPITIVVLLPVFGALVAVGVPLPIALSGVIATTGVDPYRLHRPAVHPAPVGADPFLVIAAHNR